MADRAQRLFKIIDLLKTGRPNVKALATTLQVSRRTILRDIDDLRKLSLAINFDTQKQRYTICGSMMLPETQFTLEEAWTLITLCFDADCDIPFLKPAKTAALKLQSIFPQAIQKEIHDFGNSLFLQKTPVNPLEGVESVFDALLKSVQQRHSIRIWYKSPIEPEFITLLSPYRLFFGRHAWYAIGRSSMHKEIRMFHIGRIRNFEKTGQPFEISKGFTLKQFFGNAWSMIRERGPDQEVVVRFSPLVAQNVSEVAWHPTQRILWNDDGTMDYRVTVSGLNEISWWILGYGKEAEVLQPKKLRDMIRSHVETMLQKYL